MIRFENEINFQIKPMKIVTLIENNSCSDNLHSEHGFSLYIETFKHKILFDTGKTDLFIKNAEYLNIDLQEVDTVIISHAHYDHIGGLTHFLNINQKAKVYLKKEIFDYKYFSARNKIKKYIGFPEEVLKFKNKFVFLEEDCISIDNMIFIKNYIHKYPIPKANKMLFKEIDNQLSYDEFKHEMIFSVIESEKITIFSGCAHSGILNAILVVKYHFPDKEIISIIGGFHLIDKNEFVETETETEVRFIAKELKRLTPEAVFYTGHCTGENIFSILKEILENKLIKIETGNIIQI